MQILVILTNLGYKFEVDLSGPANTVGDPIGTSTYAMDCFLKNLV
jgi:hypothetical protein